MAGSVQSRYVADMEESEELPANRGWGKRHWLGGAGLLLLLAVAILWTQRVPLARSYIDDELARRGVEASYEITEFGVTGQRIENLVIGDPDNPDLTAEWAEISVRLGFGLPEVTGIAAHGVRLRGTWSDEGELSFGAVDRLLPEPTGEPLTLPELDIALADSAVILTTPYGPAVVAIAGSGPLHDGFAGRAAGRSARLMASGCESRRLRFDVALTVRDRRPSIEGPARAERIVCPDSALAVGAPELLVEAVFSEAFDRWGGDGRVRIASLSQGTMAASDVAGRVGFDGALGERTRGFVQLAGEELRADGAASQEARIAGQYRFTPDTGLLAFDGEIRLARARMGAAMLAGLTDTLRQAEGTPFGPMGNALSDAAVRAASAFDARFSLVGAVGSGGGGVRLTDLTVRSVSGARLVFEEGEGVRAIWPDRSPTFDGRLQLAGGGFPEMLVALEQDRPGAPLDGYAQLAPFAVGDSRLVLAPVRFSAASGGRTSIVTAIEVSGPLADGRVEQLRLPVAGTLGPGGDLRIGRGCAPLSWARLRVAGLTVGQTSLPLCPLEGGTLLAYRPDRGIRGGARITRPVLRATLGGTPLLVRASDFTLPLTRPSFAMRDVAVRLGSAGSASELDIAQLAADFVPGGVDGAYSGATGQLAAVPIRLDGSDGTWRFVGGVLDIAGDGTVLNTTPDRTFEPLITRDLALHLENNIISTTGTLRAPQNDAVIATVDLTHNLGTGIGEALLVSERVEFNDRLQPSDLTRLVLGIIAEVEGLASGTGTIRWDAAGNVTSDGLYEMIDVDLAAPFGPVAGLSGRIEFTDLLGMNTVPGQKAVIRQTNPGVLVEDGTVTYQLLDANRVQVEGARWPFAGGWLILRPTILDFRVDRVRRLTFDVVGVDGFRFLEERNFENIVATGIFDGTLPMVFDQNGGRIENGSLVSREPGGTFSYTGEISDVNLGVFGSLAFNALELIRYSELTIGFNGAIDGEMVTNVEFTGVSPNIAREGQGFIVAGFTRELAQIPIRFDITLEAPFNQMLYSMRLLDDPGFLVNQAIRARINRMRAERGVQDPESDSLP